MSKYLTLVRMLFVQQFKSRVTGEGAKKKRIGTAILLVLIGLCFAPLLFAVVMAMFYMGDVSVNELHLDTRDLIHLGTYLLLNCQGFVLVFGLHTIISNVFTVKDADKLLYMPIRSHTIFAAKLTVAYLNEMITTAATVLCVLLPYGYGADMGLTYYLMLIPVLVLMPMLPMLIGCILAMPLSALMASISKNSTLKTIFRVFIYLLIMGGYMYIMYRFGFLVGTENGNILQDPQRYIEITINGFKNNASQMMPYFHPDYMLVSSMMSQNIKDWIVGFAIALGEHVALVVLVNLVSLPFYRKLLSLSLEDGGGAPKKIKEQLVNTETDLRSDTSDKTKKQIKTSNKTNKQSKPKKRSIVGQLMLSDLKRTARDGQMGFQSFTGVIMMPIVVVLLYLFMGLADEGDTSFLQLMSTSPYYQVVGPLVILAYMTFVGLSTNVLGLYPISRENRSVYILKSLPVKFSKILFSKVLLATAVMVVSDFVTCVLIVALLKVKWYYGIAMLVAMALIGFGSMCITTLLDLKYPRFGWANYTQSLKNTKNGWIAMLIGLVAIVELTLVAIMFVVWYSVTDAWYVMFTMWMVIFAMMAIFAAVAYKVMANRAAKCFEQIEI